jgi:hypothetical protein
MFNFRETKFVPGFHVREPVEEVPGFRLVPDGSIRQSSTDVASSTDQGLSAPENWLQPWPTSKPGLTSNLAFLGGGLAGMGGVPTPQAVQDALPVAGGDLKCVDCKGGRPSGMTGAYRVEGDILCHKCAVKRLGAENEPSSEIPGILRPFSLQPR